MIASKNTRPSLKSGVDAIQSTLVHLESCPGVYQMIDAQNKVLYVGKSRVLRQRVASYTQVHRLPVRLQRMVAETRTVDVLVTRSEAEALLLEANLIKKFKPRYNIRLIDDKSFPYVRITSQSTYPTASKYRGSRKEPGHYYGPFASAGAVNRTLTALQKAFQLRNCSDSVFASRSRPCQQYQIKRCSAPCVNRISPQAYQRSVEQAQSFLNGKSAQVQRALAKEMNQASQRRDYEKAALLRDRIKALTQVQARQDIHVALKGDCDVVALHRQGQDSCIQVLFFRQGSHYGNHAFFPRHSPDDSSADILEAFLAQFYSNKATPETILTSESCGKIMAEALSARAQRRVAVRCPQRGQGRAVMAQALRNAAQTFARKMAARDNMAALLTGLAELAGVEERIERVEIYDNSHTRGQGSVGAMVVAGRDGFLKGQYRKYNIKSAAGDDDVAMMAEVLHRRGLRLQESGQRVGWPQLVIIDGGAGQVAAVGKVLDELGLEIPVMGVAKGTQREAGFERITVRGQTPKMLAPTDPLLYFIQRLRDEAHRHALHSHTARRTQSALKSELSSVPGIGPRRKRALLNHFGSSALVKQATLDDLVQAPGISRKSAETIRAFFHPEA